jgi:hypothetical protein
MGSNGHKTARHFDLILLNVGSERLNTHWPFVAAHWGKNLAFEDFQDFYFSDINPGSWGEYKCFFKALDFQANDILYVPEFARITYLTIRHEKLTGCCNSYIFDLTWALLLTR